MANREIDFVLTWVDGADPEWQKEKYARMLKLGVISEADDRTQR